MRSLTVQAIGHLQGASPFPRRGAAFGLLRDGPPPSRVPVRAPRYRAAVSAPAVSILLGVAIGIAIGFLGGFLLAAQRAAATARAEATRHHDHDAAVLAELEVARSRLEDQDHLANQLRGAFAEVQGRLLAEASQRFLDLASDRLRVAQESTASEVDARRSAIDDLLRPLRGELEAVRTQVRELERSREGAYEGLKGLVERLSEEEQRLASETRNLVQALRRPTTRGRWGELQLRRVVELAQMVSYCDFTEQAQQSTTDGSGLRPDLLVHLPGDRLLVVDAKVPLEGYLDALEAQDDTTRREQLARHARQLRTHVDQLARKAYWEQFARTPEFVVAFLPGDGLLAAALEADPGLLEDALAKRVLLATPISLVALLRTAATGWHEQRLADSAKQVEELGRDLYKRIVVFADHLEKLGKQLAGAVHTYNSAVGSFERRVVPGARRFAELGGFESGASSLPPLTTIEDLAREPRLVETPPAPGAIGLADPADEREGLVGPDHTAGSGGSSSVSPE